LDNEKNAFNFLFNFSDKDRDGLLSPEEAANFLRIANLTTERMTEIWQIVNPSGKQNLNKNTFFIMLRLISMAQAGHTPHLNTALSQRVFPMVKVNGVSIRSHTFYDFVITRDIEDMYKGIFERLTKSFFLSATDAKGFFQQSNLQGNDLALIWNLSDVDSDSMLSFAEFCVAMYLVHGKLAGEPLPDTLPQTLLDFIRERQDPWVIHPNQKSQYLSLFQQKSEGNLMKGQTARELLINFNVPNNILARIWELCDRGKRGALDIVEFSAAMHIIKRYLEGTKLPNEIPSQLILSLQ